MAVLHFNHKQAQEVFCLAGGNQAPEKEIDRLWGIAGGSPDCVPVTIVEITGIEAGCGGVVV
jgi:hypothetical protein